MSEVSHELSYSNLSAIVSCTEVSRIDFIIKSCDIDAFCVLMDDFNHQSDNFFKRIVASETRDLLNDYLQIFMTYDNDRKMKNIKNILDTFDRNKHAANDIYDLFVIMFDTFPELVNTKHSNGRNVLHLICNIANYDMYFLIVSINPNLIYEKSHADIYPLYEFCSYVCGLNLAYTMGLFDNKQTIDKIDNLNSHINRIISHYLDNFHSDDPEIYQILIRCDPHISLIYKIVDSVEANKNIISDMLMNVVSNKKLMDSNAGYDLCEYLFDRGADPNYTPGCILNSNYEFIRNSGKELSSIMASILEFNNQKLIKLFKDNGCIFDLQLFEIIIKKNNFDLFDYIMDLYEFNTDSVSDGPSIMGIVMENINSSDMFFHIVEKYHPIMNTIYGGNTLLHLLFKNINNGCDHISAITEYIINNGIDLYHRNNNGECFFHSNIGINNIKLLDRLGVDLSVRFSGLNMNYNHHVLNCLIHEEIVYLSDQEYYEIIDMLVNKHQVTYVKGEDDFLLDLMKIKISLFHGKMDCVVKKMNKSEKIHICTRMINNFRDNFNLEIDKETEEMLDPIFFEDDIDTSEQLAPKFNIEDLFKKLYTKYTF